jgi:hypothetical protein
MKTIENWKLRICHLSSMECQLDGAGIIGADMVVCCPERHSAMSMSLA